MRECAIILFLASVALAGCTTPQAGSCRAWSEDRQSLAGQAIYFEPTSSTLTAEAEGKAAEVAYYMKTNPAVALRIEGHGDGRGTEKRSLELGDRRAEALRERLLQLQIDPARVDTWACGRSPHSDRAYVPGMPRKWCRAEFVVLVPPQ